jgi:hypothetical protein
LGANGTNTQYRVTIFAYRDCSPNDGGVPFDNEVGLCVYNENKSLYTSYKAKLISEKSVDPVGNTACPEVAKACLKQGVYEVNITLPNSTTGYHLKWSNILRIYSAIGNRQQFAIVFGFACAIYLCGRYYHNSESGIGYRR